MNSSTTNKKLDDLMHPLLSDSQLKLVQDGVHHMFGVIRDVVTTRERGNKLPQKELIERLNQMEQKEWKKIRSGILENKYHGYASEQYTAEENMSPVKIMYDLMKIVDNLKDLIEKRLKEHRQSEAQLREEIQKMQTSLSDLEVELMTEKNNRNKDKGALNIVMGKMEHLEQMNRSKSEKISELQRESNVKLWGIEKERILAKANEREKELEAQVAKLKSEKDSVSKKLEMFESNYKKEKIKNELVGRQKSADTEGGNDLVKAKQHIYVLEKDLRAIENELFSQQKYMIGLLRGIKEDYWSAWDPVMSEGTADEEQLGKGRRLGSRIVKIFEAAAEGKLGSIRADLPENYLATDRDVNRVSVKKISSSYGVRLEPISRNGALATNGIISQLGQSQLGKATDDQPEEKKKSSVLPEEHPVLVNPRTGFVHMITVLKWFPFMTEEYIKEQWGHFKTYDTNGDGDLDLPELMNAMSLTNGGKFSAAQVKEAMMEVDLDGSCTIDFFEYLSIASMLQDKKGRAEVFRSKEARESGKQVSKTCAIQ